jgi:integrase/recombinase XerD
MLTIYRRHLKDCTHRDEGRGYRDCRCPIWVDGFLRKEGEIRRSLKTRSWTRANTTLHEWEAAEEITGAEDEPTTIQQVTDEFITSAASKRLKKSTIGRYQIIFRQLNAFAVREGLRFVNQLDTRTLNRFRSTWQGDSALADLKKLERLRAFFKFAMANGYVSTNPATAVENPKVRPNPTLPFSPDEMLAILAAGTNKISECRPEARMRARRTRALALFLRYTGLRISDAVGCATDRLQGSKIFLYTQKTGQHVYLPLPEFVVKELEALPRVSDHYWFWTGVGSVETARKKWTEALSNLFEDAKVKNGHAHRFRDTFAVELLKAGTPIERVSILLGHASVRVTERHYNPWNRARQEQAEADVIKAWTSDPVILMESQGTPEVHGRNRRTN